MQNGSASQKPVILVVDDQKCVRVPISELLQEEFRCSEVYTAENGEAAMDLVRQHKTQLSLVITDIQMPKMDGIALVQSIEAEFRHTPNTKPAIVIMSAIRPRETTLCSLKNMGVQFYQKPGHPDALTELAKNVMQK